MDRSLLLFFLLSLFVASSVCNDEGVAICACARIYRPVCASDMRTYNNNCEFECQANHVRQLGRDLYIIKNGRCNDYVLNSFVCPGDFAPTLGRVGRTRVLVHAAIRPHLRFRHAAVLQQMCLRLQNQLFDQKQHADDTACQLLHFATCVTTHIIQFFNY
ncbi:unnamed protein product [Chilo suppressalis]|uniref:Kazal-like domain-containing protein n=1 Tax=Chilo suppressalis TaxID=168631 RepID=A0ABN8AXJ6_CHISP|nr:unnamed protein product [Chilo suppressalis]